MSVHRGSCAGMPQTVNRLNWSRTAIWSCKQTRPENLRVHDLNYNFDLIKPSWLCLEVSRRSIHSFCANTNLIESDNLIFKLNLISSIQTAIQNELFIV